jgi:transposase
MKNDATKAVSPGTTTLGPVATAAGLDVSDRTCALCIVREDGEVAFRATFRTTRDALAEMFQHRPPIRIALEVGTHSRWISRALAAWGHEVIVANARKLRLIFENDNKRDPVDAEILARFARADPKLLFPIHHRSESRDRALAVVRARDPLVRARVLLVNHVRGAVKPLGARIAPCSTETFGQKAAAQLPRELADVLQPVLDQITALTHTIRTFDRQIEKLATVSFPETAPLRQIPGVGALTALAFVLTLDDPARFDNARAVGAYLGLRPRRGQSGHEDPQLRITKAGDPYLRALLVQSAHYTLGRFGPDSDLRRWGLRLAKQSPPASGETSTVPKRKRARSDQVAKKKAVVAVARKLSAILYRLWVDQVDYEPLRAPPPVRRRRANNEPGKMVEERDAA